MTVRSIFQSIDLFNCRNVDSLLASWTLLGVVTLTKSSVWGHRTTDMGLCQLISASGLLP